MSIIRTLLIVSLLFTASLFSQEEKNMGIASFTPPKGWSLADESVLPPAVKIMVVGKGSGAFPPSMNLSTQPYRGTLKQYLKIIKSINDSQGYEWKDLGNIKTEAGVASLSQVDTKNEFGAIRQMHVVLLKNGQIYILTAAALKEDFSKFYKDFFDAFHSLKVNNDIFEMIKDQQRRTKLQESLDNVMSKWQAQIAGEQQSHPNESMENIKEKVFAGDAFQKGVWKPFKESIERDYKDMGQDWQKFVITKTEDDLFQ
jgi:hypothetical protein